MRFHQRALAAVAILLVATSSVDAFTPHHLMGTQQGPVSFASYGTMHSHLHASTLERLPDSAVKVKIGVPGSATKAAYEKVCNELSKSISVPGFRKGSRIPPAVLEQSMLAKGGKYALRVQAINALLAELIEPALKEEHGLEPIGQPALETSAEEIAVGFTPGQDLELAIKCDVWPEIKWKGATEGGSNKSYMGLKGTYQRKPFDQVKFNKALNDLRERYAMLEAITDANHELQMGDACVVNMEGYMATATGEKGDKLPEAASGDRVEVILGGGRYMTGLVEGLVGAKVGDVRTVTVTFPTALRDKALAGMKALFDVTVLEASKRTLPEVTDEFANEVRAGLTAESLKAELQKAVDSEDAKEYAPARNAAIAKALSEVMDVEVPDTLVTNQAKEKFAMMMTDMRNNGVPDEEIKKQISPDNFLKYKKIVRDDIIKDFKVSMATDEIARLESIEVPDHLVEEQMEAVRQEAAESKDTLDEGQIRTRVEATLQRQAVMDFLAEHSQLEVQFLDEDGNFDEALMEKLAAESLAREVEIAAQVAASVEVSDTTASVAVEELETLVEAEAEVSATFEEEVIVETAKDEVAPPKRDMDSMSLEDKAYYALLDSGALKFDDTN